MHIAGETQPTATLLVLRCIADEASSHAINSTACSSGSKHNEGGDRWPRGTNAVFCLARPSMHALMDTGATHTGPRRPERPRGLQRIAPGGDPAHFLI
jgi:hypothetical protein